MADTPPSPSKSTVFIRRLSSTLFLWGLVAAVFISRQSWAFLLLISLLAILATVEYFRMLRREGIPCFPRFGIAAAIGYCLAVSVPYASGKMPTPGLESIAFFLVTVVSYALQLRHPIRGKDPLIAVAATLLGFAYIPFLFLFSARLIFSPADAFAHVGKVSSSGAFLLLWLIAVTKFSDMGAYITGSLIGKHKMIPHVSPAKTWEGFGGAIAFSLLAACGLYALFPNELAVLTDYRHVIVLGVSLSVLAVVGDLAESLVKRSAAAKDSGHFLPGIGGALDLIDSICFTAPMLYLYLHWFLISSP